VLLQIFFCQENFLLKTIIKTKVDTPEKCFVPKTFGPRLWVWPKRTFKGETETNCGVRRTVNLSKYVDCMCNMTKWNSHSCFCVLADPYTSATMHSEWDLNAKKTVQETYNCVLEGLPLLHLAFFFYRYDISIPQFPSRCRTVRFPD